MTDYSSCDSATEIKDEEKMAAHPQRQTRQKHQVSIHMEMCSYWISARLENPDQNISDTTKHFETLRVFTRSVDINTNTSNIIIILLELVDILNWEQLNLTATTDFQTFFMLLT